MGRIAMQRLVLGSDGAVNKFTASEDYTSEAIKQLMLNAPYQGEPIGKYELLDNCYRATGGFETGDYLIPHPSEKLSKYVRRQNMSYYINYVKPVVDAHVNPIFKNSPTRQNTSKLFDLFINDVDGNKTTLTRFMKKAAIRAKLHGVEFIVIDMEKLDKDIVTEKEVIEKRLYPYLYLVSPSQVTNWATDKFGKLTYISYQLENTSIGDDGSIIENTESWTWTNNKCIKSTGDNSETFENPIGVIPVVPLYGAINDSNSLIPQSDIYSIARTNLSLYNACSELRERNRAQAFSILTFPISDDDDYDNGEEPIKYGTADCLLYRGSAGGQPPAFITPPTAPSDIIMNEINFQIKEIYRMANLQLVTGVQQSNVSGLAKEWDNQNLFQTILELAQGLQEAEYKLANIFSILTGEKMDNLSITYNNQFGIVDSTTVLTNATQALSLNISKDYNVEIKKQVVRSTLKDSDNSITDKVIKSLEADPNAGEPLEESTAKVVQPVR